MTVFRGASAIGRAKSFTVHSSEGRLAALVQPPWPFEGRAGYRKSPGSPPTWRGTLRVPIPGAGTLRMAGRRFSASLCVKPTSLPGCTYHSVQVFDTER
jgi:hypothetical protein